MNFNFHIWGYARTTKGEIVNWCVEVGDNHNLYKMILTKEEMEELKKEIELSLKEVETCEIRGCGHIGCNKKHN